MRWPSGDQAAALRLTEAAGAAGAGTVAQSVESLGVEPHEALTHGLGMAA
jgi:hypothetical protein